MTLTALECTRCGAPLIFINSAATCDYCGMRFSLDTPFEPEPEWDSYFCEPSDYFYRGGMSVRTSRPTGPNQWDYPDDVLKANPNGA